MKIGVISDIHADLPTLQEALTRLEAFHRVDLILCGGDLTGYGPQPNEVITVIRRAQVPTVRGNHDSPSAQITPENAAYLRALPMSWSGEYETVRLFMCHGRPGINFIGFHPLYTTDEELEALLNDVNAQVIITGHTHHPMLRQVTNGWVFNPGAVYGRKWEDITPTYGLIHLPEMRFEVFDLTQPVGSVFAL